MAGSVCCCETSPASFIKQDKKTVDKVNAMSIPMIKTSFQRKALFVAIAVASVQGASSTVSAQEQTDVVEEVVVTGIKQSLRLSADLKRDADSIKEAITAEDVGEFPDDNVTESLSRISGVQITRDVGAGAGFTIRGISQNRVEVNGRTSIGRGEGRNANISDMPASLLGGLEVIKSPTADLVEGALGGTVNLKTRRPFDFKKPSVTLNARERYGSEAKAYNPSLNLLMTDTWDTGIGEIGALVNASYSVTTRLEQRARFNNWRGVCNVDLDGDGVQNNKVVRDELGRAVDCQNDPDDFVYRPSTARALEAERERTRQGVVTSLQWQASDDLQFYFDGNYNQFFDNDYRYAIIPGTSDNKNVQGITLADDGLASGVVFGGRRATTQSQATERDSDSYSFAIGGEWYSDVWKLSGEMGASSGEGNVENLQVNGRTRSTGDFTMGVSDSRPVLQTSNDLTDIANFQIVGANNDSSANTRDEAFVRFDVDYDLSDRSSFFTLVETGIRVTDESFERSRFRDRFNDPGNAGALNTAVENIPGLEALMERRDIGDFLDNFDHVDAPDSYYVADASRNIDNRQFYRELFQLPAEPTRIPTEEYAIDESTQALYLKLSFESELFGVPFDGNFGVRYVETQTDASTLIQLEDGNLVPSDVGNDYNNLLPSANVRFLLDEDLQLRFAAASTVVRPDFHQLRPAVAINFASGEGTENNPLIASRGNPELSPFEATQYDVSLEKYFGDGDMLSSAIYYRDVGAFIANEVRPLQTISGVTDSNGDPLLINVRMPVNGDSATVYGYELNGQYTFDQLEGWLGGFGITANYTYSDSDQSGELSLDSQGRELPLNGLSKHSFNTSVFYQASNFSARLAYNWRDDWLTNNFSGNDGRALFRAAQDQLDLNGSYTFGENKRYKVSFSARNVLQRQRKDYLEEPSAVTELSSEDVQFELGLRVKFQ